MFQYSSYFLIEQMNDNQKYVYYSPEKPIYRCEHCPYFVAIKHLMDNHIKYPNYECLQLRTAKEMEQSVIKNSAI